MNQHQYCAVIRTLGRAGEKYQRELDSLCRQTMLPEKILVYIPDGYPLPKETCGREEYVRSPKGMIAQRSLPFKEVDTDYILFLDDDIELAEDGVEKLFAALDDNHADVIIPNTFVHQEDSLVKRVFAYFHSGQKVHHLKDWSIRIGRDGGFSFNPSPKKSVLFTQSGPGTCCLCKRQAYDAIHFEDERWLEQFKYASGDDQLFFYKMYLYGYKLLTIYDSGIKHLDARSAGRPDISLKQRYQKAIAFIIWWRTQYDVRGRGRLRCALAFSWRMFLGMLFCPVEAAFYRHPRFIPDFFRGLHDGWKYVHSEEYRRIPKYEAYKANKANKD